METISHAQEFKIKRWLPLLALAGLMAVGYALGLQHYLTLQSIAENASIFQNYVSAHLISAVLIYAFAYILAVALSFPGAGLLSIFGGFVFGWALSAPITVVAATLGAMVVFKIVQTSLGAAIAERASPFVKKLSGGFEEDGFNYLLFLRLVPAFPFFAVNAVAGLTKMPLRTFAIGTLIGIIPGSYAFAWLGRGFGSVIEAQRVAHDACVLKNGLANCPFEISTSSLITPQLLWAFAALGLISLIPVVLKKLKVSK
jgi:uncharacterized membrane protein YdjX (TVP38/TMEM64 family)